MPEARSTLRLWAPWLVIGPAFACAGVAVGTWWEGSVRAAAGERVLGMPSLAPIVDAVRSGVVGIRTVHRAVAEVGVSEAHGVSLATHGESRGTGFFIHETGLILTARHLVVEPERIVVEVPDVGRLDAHLVGSDPSTDLAVLRLLDAPPGLFVPEFGDSSTLRQGDWVVTIGNPLAFQHSVGVGVVAFVGRHLLQDGFHVTNDYLQFSAPAYPGSSGSPVFDMTGRVVGITTRSARDGDGLSFAIPAKVIRQVLHSMEENDGRVQRAYLGIEFTPVERNTARRHGLPEGVGVLVTAVSEGRPAAAAGVREGDVIVRFGGIEVTDVHELHDRITWSTPGARTTLELVRDGELVGPLEVVLDGLGDPSPRLSH